MKKYLIVLDLDGTLLSDWQSISDETVQYIKQLKTKGHQFVIATGRPFRSSEEYHNLLELDTPIINYNGGLVTSRKDPNFVPYSITIDKAKILDIFTKNREFIHNAFGEVKDDIYLLEDTEEIRPLLHYFNGAKLTVGEFDKILKQDTNGFIIISNNGDGQYIEQYVKENYPNDVLSRNWGNDYDFIIELFTPKTNKGNAVKYVSEYLGFKPEDIIAIGDGHNDIEMIEFAGLGVAMANAHPELLEAADYVCKYTNKEDGVMKFLQDFFEEKKAN